MNTTASQEWTPEGFPWVEIQELRVFSPTSKWQGLLRLQADILGMRPESHTENKDPRCSTWTDPGWIFDHLVKEVEGWSEHAGNPVTLWRRDEMLQERPLPSPNFSPQNESTWKRVLTGFLKCRSQGCVGFGYRFHEERVMEQDLP